jgi:hypothetical protein
MFTGELLGGLLRGFALSGSASLHAGDTCDRDRLKFEDKKVPLDIGAPHTRFTSFASLALDHETLSGCDAGAERRSR